jgi:hypothetical protein
VDHEEDGELDFCFYVYNKFFSTNMDLINSLYEITQKYARKRLAQIKASLEN